MTEAAIGDICFTIMFCGILTVVAIAIWARRPHCNHHNDIDKLSQLLIQLIELNARHDTGKTGDTQQ